jgi:hypothetical protein
MALIMMVPPLSIFLQTNALAMLSIKLEQVIDCTGKLMSMIKRQKSLIIATSDLKYQKSF